jgi:hypothetical protein
MEPMLGRYAHDRLLSPINENGARRTPAFEGKVNAVEPEPILRNNPT